MSRLIFLISLLLATVCVAQQFERDLASYIGSIQAIDNHAHVLAPDVSSDKGYDALRCEELPASVGPDPANLRFGPATQLTWKTLYGTEPSSAEQADKQHEQMVAKLRQEHGDNYYDWLLQQAGVSTVLANRVAMTPGLQRPRFVWVPFVDALLIPLNNEKLKEENPDRRALFNMEEQVRQNYLQQSGLSSLPRTLDEYLNKVLRPVLEREKKSGAVAVKFEAAYLRPLDFAPATRESAAAIYQRWITGATPPASDYKVVQDYLFHEIAVEAGRLGMAVHIHTGSGCGQFFHDPGSDPMLLSAVFNDPTLRGTNFVMLHGGSPFDRHIMALLVKPNVYVDTSVLEFMLSVPELARVLRPWLETMPERILYGSDAGSFGPGMGWQETNWLATHNFRLALTRALSEMINDGVITMSRAKEIAQGILRGNALQLYHLQGQQP
jgi:predicted TIM-barrel fold metal-dependent hydrolase